MVGNMIEPLQVMSSIRNYMKLKVSVILLVYTHHLSIILHILLASSDVCYTNIPWYVWKLSNDSGYVWCTGKNQGIIQLCPSGTKASHSVGGCVNETSK